MCILAQWCWDGAVPSGPTAAARVGIKQVTVHIEELRKTVGFRKFVESKAGDRNTQRKLLVDDGFTLDCLAESMAEVREAS